MGQVIIGMDLHRRSATIEVINDREKVLAQGRFDTDHAGYQTMLELGRQHRDRIWADGSVPTRYMIVRFVSGAGAATA